MSLDTKKTDPKSAPVWLQIVVGLIIVGVIAAYVSGPDHARTTSAADATAAAPAGNAASAPIALQLPPDQTAFINAAEAGKTAYKAAGNEMAKGATRPQRGRALCQAVHMPNVKGWRGQVETLSSNSDGKGILAVRISRDVVVKTWNNDLSDIGDNTLLNPASTVFAQAVALKAGQAVTFSGSLIRSDVDCFHEASMTMDGSMTEPEFIFRFSAIAPAE